MCGFKSRRPHFVVSRSKYTRELLAPIIAEARSLAGVLRALGLKPTGGNYRSINGRIQALELDTSHFVGQAWSRGQTSESSEAVRRTARIKTHPNDVVFVEHCSVVVRGTRLTARLRQLGWPYVCAECGISSWRGRPITLHLDHVNGIHTDNRLENLRFLCPNCHQQTETWGNGYKRARPRDDGSDQVREPRPIYLTRLISFASTR